MTKSKRSSSYMRYFLTRFFGTIGFILCGLLSTCSVYMRLGTIQVSINSDLLPTAEYLYSHPQPTPDDVYVWIKYIRYENYDMSLHSRSELEPELCAGYAEVHESLSHSLSYMVLDGIIPQYRTEPNLKSQNLTRPSYLYCIDRSKLTSGLHLVELYLKREPGDTPIIYQGAVMIE